MDNLSKDPLQPYIYVRLRKVYLLSILFFAVPFLIFLVLKTQFNSDILYRSDFLHFIVIIAFSVMGFFIALAGYKAYASSADLRLIFIVMGFIVFGIVFSLHAFVPFLTLYQYSFSSGDFLHHLFEITEHYSLFFVSLLVFIGASLPLLGESSRIYRKRWYIFGVIQILLLLFFLLILFAPGFTIFLEKTINAIVLITGVLFLGAAVKLLDQYKLSPSRFALYLILGLSVLINTAIIPLFYKEWSLCWWYFHIVILSGFGIIALGMVIRWLQEKSLS